MRYTCIESTLDFIHGPYTVRLWVNRVRIPKAFAGDEVMLGVLQGVERELSRNLSLEELIDRLAAFPAVNAVQVQQRFADGVTLGTVVYTVPFEGHG